MGPAIEEKLAPVTMAKVSIRQFATTIDVRRGQSILEAAQKAGLDYPFACRSGNCSSCKSQLFFGSVEHKPYDPSALTEAERNAGLILACRASPTSDCDVAFLEEEELTFSPAEAQCTITRIERVTPDIAVVGAATKGGQPPSFAAGQFARLTLPGMPARDYSFANRPGARELEFHVRAREDGKVSRHIYDRSRIGDTFALKAPYGTAYLRKSHPGPIVMVVGGTGLAPAKSILLDALATMPGRRISLYACVRAEHDLYQVDELVALAAKHPHFAYHPFVTRPADGSTRTNVFDQMSSHFPSLAGCKIYTCGSPSLVSACRAYVQEHGVAPSDCHADPFVVSSEPASTEQELITQSG